MSIYFYILEKQENEISFLLGGFYVLNTELTQHQCPPLGRTSA